MTKLNHLAALSVDVEDYFQVSAFENIIKRSDWDLLEHRVNKNTHKILDLFAKANAKGTFFVLGWVAQKHPDLVKRIVAEGHEIASHGFYHQRLTCLSYDEVKKDIKDSKQLLEDISGKDVLGYRAPSFSINKNNLWVFDILSELDFKYSSSTYPVKHDLYGVPEWPRIKHQLDSGLWEIPMSTAKVFDKNVPISGGGYFRLLPLWYSLKMIERYMKKETEPYMFYFHPWEIDPEQPRFDQATAKAKFRHYTNLKNMESKVVTLLDKYQWQPIKNVYDII